MTNDASSKPIAEDDDDDVFFAFWRLVVVVAETEAEEAGFRTSTTLGAGNPTACKGDAS